MTRQRTETSTGRPATQGSQAQSVSAARRRAQVAHVRRERRRLDGADVRQDVRRPGAGDLIEVFAPSGRPARRGIILEVLGSAGHERFRVRWDESHASIFYPGEGVRYIHP